MVHEEKGNLPFSYNFPVQVQMSILSNGSEYMAYICPDLGKFHCFSIELKPQDIEELNLELQCEIERVSQSYEGELISDDALSKLAQKGKFAFNRIFAEGVPRETIRKALKTNATIQLATRDFVVPWELLYDGPLGAQVDVSRFWGMQYIVSRSLIQDARPGDLASPIIQ